MKKEDIKTVYFAHPKVHYDTDIESECLDIIITMLTPILGDQSNGSIDIFTNGSIDIFNPNQKWLSDLYMNRKKAGDTNPFEIFREIARSHDIVVGVTYLDGILGAGVAEELKEAAENGKKTYLIYFSNGVKLFSPFYNLDNYKVLTIQETHERNEKGQV